MIRKYSTIEDLLFSSKNIIAVKEEMKIFNDLLKMLLDTHQEYNRLLGEDERGRDDNWFDHFDYSSMFVQEEGTLFAERSCSESQIIKMFIQEQHRCI